MVVWCGTVWGDTDMNKFILLTFGVLGFAWYELSGGSEFQAGQLSQAPEVQVSPLNAAQAADASAQPEVETVAVVAASLVPSAPQPAKPAAVAQPETVLQTAASVVAQPDPVVASVAPVSQPATEAETPVLLTTRSEVSAPVATPTQAQLRPDIRYVTGSRVNLREGPGTSFAVVGKLSDGDEVEVLKANDDGWLQVLTSDTGNIGWMADWLVTAAN